MFILDLGILGINSFSGRSFPVMSHRFSGSERPLSNTSPVVSNNTQTQGFDFGGFPDFLLERVILILRLIGALPPGSPKIKEFMRFLGGVTGSYEYDSPNQKNENNLVAVA